MAIDDLIALVREKFSYDELTGKFVYKTGKNAGRRAGSIKRGYRRLKVAGKSYKAARLAWLFVYGKWPDGVMDHINGCRDDDRICNLRDVSVAVNTQNQKAAQRDSMTGWLGVTTSKRGKYVAKLTIGRNQYHCGTYETPEEAHKAYLVLKRALHPGCTI